jgi:hypothetical protein
LRYRLITAIQCHLVYIAVVKPLACFLMTVGFCLPLYGQIETQPESGTTLKLGTIGEVTLRNGHRGAFRDYIGPTGDTGRVVYAKLDSVEDAERQTVEWRKVATKIRSRETR